MSKNTFARVGCKWEYYEDLHLLDGIKDGRSIDELAIELARTPKAIVFRRYNLAARYVNNGMDPIKACNELKLDGETDMSNLLEMLSRFY